MPAQLVIVLIALLGNIFLGLFTYYKNPKSATNTLFFLFTLAISAYLIINHLALIQSTDQATFFWIKMVMSIALIINLLFFLLVNTFPNTKLQLRHALLAISIIVTILLLPATLLGLVFRGVVSSTTQPVPGPVMPLFLLQTIIFLGGGFANLIYKLRKAVGVEKMQIRLFLMGAVFMFLSIVVTNLLFVLILKTTAFVGFLPIYTLIFVGFISYAIVKHKFLDISLLVARTVSFAILTGLFGLVYALFFAISSSLFTTSTIELRAIAISTLLALIMAFSFQPLRRALEKITDKFFYKGHYDVSKMLYDLALIMASTIRLEDLTGQLLDDLLLQMRISRGVFILVENSEVYQIINKGYEVEPRLGEEDIHTLNQLHQIIIFEELSENYIKKLLRKLNIAVIVPLSTKNEEIGLLVLGEKLSGDIYTSGDLRVLEIIAPEIAVAIQNSKAYEEIRRFNVTLQEEVQKATSDLKTANQRLEELDKLKDDFVSITSHELRTPMTAIRSYAWMALNRPDVILSEKLKKYLVRVLISTGRLINLVNDMLNISRIESGRIEINPEPIDMILLCKDIIDEVYYSKSTEKYIKFHLLEQPIPKVFADPNKLRQIVLNIVGNALKFSSPEGNITIGFFTDGVVVETYIKDEGPGISIEDMGRLFKKFGRLDNSYTATATSGGTGLGLYISKGLIELMHGKIWAESQGLGKGATFKFSLPIASKENLAHADLFRVKPEGEIKQLEPAVI